MLASFGTDASKRNVWDSNFAGRPHRLSGQRVHAWGEQSRHWVFLSLGVLRAATIRRWSSEQKKKKGKTLGQ